MKQIYNVGIYCRLSVDDASNSAKARTYIPADESVSIENQRELLSKFVMLNGWIETKVYCDDGYSGGNFQRPGFLEMLEDARQGVINLILVKDLSRLGRDYVEVGRYVDTVFPSLGCRFVSMLDCLDSEGGNTDMLHFRSLMNDYHLRDLSSKVKSVLRSKKASGQYVAAMAPYGYCKSDEDRHKLAVDAYAAGIIRRIFDMRKSGMAYGRIVAVLNQEGIPSPKLYWQQNNGKDCSSTKQLWTYTMVKHILKNEVYCGVILTNRTGTRSYKDSTKINKPEGEWLRHEAAHEAIISPEVWTAVQKINEATRLSTRKEHPPTPKLFSGKLICADCKHTLTANRDVQQRKNGDIKQYIYYQCSLHIRSGCSVCSAHRIYEKMLSGIVLAEIKAHAQAVVIDETAVIDRLKQRIIWQDEHRLTEIRKEIHGLQCRVQELENLIARLYEDKYSGAISESTFTMLAEKNEQERLSKTEHLNALQSKISAAEKELTVIHNWVTVIRKYRDLAELDRTVIDELIDHIEIGEHSILDGQRRQDIKVVYRFVGAVGKI